MNIYDALSFLSYLIGIGANAAVAAVCFAAFRKFGHRSLKLVAISAMLGIFVSAVDIALLPMANHSSTYAILWTAITILGVIDLILYAIGIVRLMSWLTDGNRLG